MSGSPAPGQYWKPIFEQIIDSLPWNVRGAQRLLKAEKFEREAGRGRLEVACLVPCLPPRVPAFCPSSRPAPGCCLITSLTDRSRHCSPDLPWGKSARGCGARPGEARAAPQRAAGADDTSPVRGEPGSGAERQGPGQAQPGLKWPQCVQRRCARDVGVQERAQHPQLPQTEAMC